MRGSLQEQLMKAGLVKDKPAAKKHSKSTKKHQKQAKRNKSSKTEVKAPANKVKDLADNELPKEIKLEIKGLLKENRLNNKEGESPFNYTIGNQIKRCYVTKEQLTKIQNGDIMIINWNDRSYLLPAELLSKLKELHPSLRYYYSQVSSSDNDDSAYQEHPIPEDLHW